MHIHEAHALCAAHMNKYVRIQMYDGGVYDGVIENVDGDHVYIVSPVREDDGTETTAEDSRALGFPGGFGHGFFPHHGFGHPFFPHPRFRRFALPLFGLTGLTLLPFWFI